MTFRYREDIDWLRAIAVLAVVAFHFEAPVYGGFVGVDIFFVISGYLITGIIQAELKNGAFSFARFYERRVRRLLPALYVMVALISHSVVPLSADLRAHGVLSLGDFRRHLHLKFLLLVPDRLFRSCRDGKAAAAHLVAGGRRTVLSGASGHALAAVVCGTRPPFCIAGSPCRAVARFLCLLDLADEIGPSATAFFLSPPRAWEFLIGGLVAVEGFPVPRHALARTIARGAALVLLAIAIFGLRQGPGFPGFDALTPCIGAALFIWSGIGVPSPSRPAYAPLETVRFFGLISYSLYLWHWPIFTFAHFAKDGLVLDAADKLVLFGITVGVSCLSWRFVERPFRAGMLMPTRRSAFAVAGVASACLRLRTRWLHARPNAVQCRPLRARARGLSFLRLQFALPLRNLLWTERRRVRRGLPVACGRQDQLDALGRQLRCALLPRPAQGRRSA